MQLCNFSEKCRWLLQLCILGYSTWLLQLNRICCMETQVFEIVCGGIIALISTAAFTHPALSKAWHTSRYVVIKVNCFLLWFCDCIAINCQPTSIKRPFYYHLDSRWSFFRVDDCPSNMAVWSWYSSGGHKGDPAGYSIPKGVDLFISVSAWCQNFSCVFARALAVYLVCQSSHNFQDAKLVSDLCQFDLDGIAGI